MISLYKILTTALGIVQTTIIIHFIMSWLISFGVLNMRQPIVAQIWDGLNRLLEPLYGPIRRMLPQMTGIDLSPMVALFGIYILQTILFENREFFLLN